MENIIETILKTVAELGDGGAVSDEKGTLSYNQLLSYAKVVAGNLQKKGIKYGDRIVIEIPRCKEYAACLLGVWIMGCVAIPLSDDYPEERLNYIKQDSKYSIAIDNDFIENLDTSVTAEPIIPNIEDAGLVIYTSGSTGNPKGVVHTYQSMSAVVVRNTAHDANVKTKKNTIVGLIAPFTFIVGQSMVLAGFSLGKHLVLAPDEIRKDPFKLAKYYDENDIQSGFVPPKLVNFMIEHNKSLKSITVGSERVTNMFYDEKPSIDNVYGATETFGGILAFHIDKKYENTPIGQPFGPEKAYVLDDLNNEVEQGELCIAGYVAQGYLNLEEQSKAVFVENPFKEKDGYPRMFRTRDIVRRMEDGNLVFVERKDWMIKINGQRVEPLEIEKTIRRMKGIREVAIKDFTAKNGVTYLAAYYVCDNDIDENMIKKHCEENLTSYMVPSFYIKLDALPVNPNGKLDRKNLPEPNVEAFKKEYVAPKGKIEIAICKAVEEVLKCGQVGRDDDFFLLGGDSIKALDMINVLEDLPIDLEMVFTGKTPAEIAKLVENGGKDEIEFERVKKDSYPLTSSQLGVYFPSISNPENLQYNNPIKIELNKKVDVEKVINAVETAINNHKAYKCHIGIINGTPSMIPYETEIKVSREKVDDMDKALKDFVKPFILDKDQLIRATLFESKDRTVIAIDAHHIVFDGTSLAVMLREMKSVFNGKDLYEERTSAFDLSSYEDALKVSPKYEEAKNYCEGLFDGLDIANDFPVDFEDEGKATQGIVDVNFDLNAEALKKYLKSNGITENSLFLSVFAYVLAKFNGSDKSIVCVAESGRHTSMTFNTAGMLVKTIALPVDLSQHADISNFVRYMQNMFKESCKQDSYPFSELASKYSLNNDFMFVYQGDNFTKLTLGDESYPVVGIENPNSISKLSLMMFSDSENSYRLSFRYRSDLFLKEIIESFGNTFVQVAKEFISKEVFNDVKLVSKQDIKALNKFNDNRTNLRLDHPMDCFDVSVKKHPNKDMVVCEEKRYTYHDVDVTANKIAHYIAKLNLKHSDVVSILIPRNEWMILATCGVLRAGCTYQPLDNTYPTERLSFMVKDANAKLLIAQRGLENLIQGYSGPILFIDEIEDLKDDSPIKNYASIDDTMILLYTSGTTGTPKGVMLTFRNLSTICQFNLEKFNLNEESNIAQYASYGFDAGMNDIMNTLYSGATLYIIPTDMRLNLMEVNKFYNENKITDGFMTTQVGRQFSTICDSPFLKHLLVGGEKLVPADSKKTFIFSNGYGPTECSIFSSVQDVDKDYYRIPIGKINPNLDGYVVDKNLNRVPVGVPGELLIAGPQVGKGYLNLEEKTEKTFIKNPFNKEKYYDRAYRTGDIVRFLKDGTIDYIGRNDGQVKIRGFRIELSEVEKVIREFDGIKDATVTAFDAANGGKYLAGYVVSDKEINLDDLRKFIASKKPSYMVPEAMMQIDAIPLNQNHKVNKRALPVITRTAKKVDENHVDNVIVSKIKELIKSILGTDEFNYDDNLFDYGMNSLSVVRLSVLLNEEFGLTIDVKELLEECSIHSLETFVINFLLSNKGGVKEEKREVRDAYPLIKSQVGVYTEYLKDSTSVKYNIPVAVSYSKEKYPTLTANGLREAVLGLIEAHESLKATIQSDKDGNFVMIPHHDNKIEIEIKKLTSNEFEEVKKNFVKPFDLSKGVCRFVVIELENSINLLSDIHHIMFDGFSQGVFFDELEKAILGDKIQKEKYTIFDASIDEEKARASEKYSEAKDYYTNLVSIVDGATVIERDAFGKEPVPSTYNSSDNSVSVEAVNKFAKENNITLNAFFMSAFSILLARYTYQDNICFTTVYNGRNTLDLNKVIGMTVKTLPIVNNLAGNTPVKDFLLANKKQLLSSMEHDVYSFSEISREFDIAMEIICVYQGYVGGNTNYEMSFMSLNDLKAPLDIEIRNDDENFYYHVEYDSGKYSELFISRLVKSLINVVGELLTKKTIDEISLVYKSSKEEMDKFNSATLDYDKRPLIYQLSESFVNYKDKTAVVFKDVRITYAQFDEETEKVAHSIKKFGVSRNDVVAILLPRNEKFIISQIATLKTGAAYQPIDSSYPSERINFMLKDSNAKLLITCKEYRDLANEYKGEVLFIEDFSKLKKPTSKLELVTQSDDLFVLLYTSGTTGVPKGVMLLNSNLSDFIAVDSKARNIDENTISTMYASFGFDANFMETFSPLIHGATIHIIPEEMRLDIPQIEEYFIKNKVTHGFMTTQMARQFCLMTKSPYLKSFSFGGEKIVPFYRSDAKFEAMNCYGPTEGTCYSNYFIINDNYERVPIGKPHPNTRVYVIDKNNNRLPIGAVGELAIAGHQVSAGYLNRPDKTESVFIKNPFTQEEGYKVLYKTGDVVRLLNDGGVDIIGRNDGQVKVRGFRVELQEVEEIVRRFEGIKDATVNAYDDPNGGKYIAAFVVSDSKVNVADLNAFILNEKPPYICPKVTMQIDAIPLNANGKVDKRKLPEPDLSSAQDNYVAPTNNVEKEFCELFGNILGVSKVSAIDDFFMLGGTSINAAQVVSFAFTKGYDIVYKNVFDNPTPRKLAQFLASTQNVEIKDEKLEEFNGNVEPIFANNTSEQLDDLIVQDTGNIVLYGATGFLGIHVLKELIDNTDKKIICVIRGNDLNNPKDRLITLLEYYFEDPFIELFDKRIFVIQGDLFDDQIEEKLSKYDFGTIINCAAMVKHFASDGSIEKTNTGGVINLINLAKNMNKRLIHVSTLSVSGETTGNIPSDFKYCENMLDIGQILDNKYTKSKFDAECEIKNAIANDGLKAKIIRVGNLMSRSNDGEFQINFFTNNFMNTIKAFKIMGCVPFDMLTHNIEFSQIDLVSKAIVMLASTNDKFNVFHVNNIHYIQMNNVINEMNRNGLNIKRVTNEEFGLTLNRLLNGEKDVRSLNSLLAYRANRNEKRQTINTDNKFTLDTLYRLGFMWPLPDSDYLSKLIDYLVSLEFFNDK